MSDHECGISFYDIDVTTSASAKMTSTKAIKGVRCQPDTTSGRDLVYKGGLQADFVPTPVRLTKRQRLEIDRLDWNDAHQDYKFTEDSWYRSCGLETPTEIKLRRRKAAKESAARRRLARRAAIPPIAKEADRHFEWFYYDPTQEDFSSDPAVLNYGSPSDFK